jgi:hypothetical protein
VRVHVLIAIAVAMLAVSGSARADDREDARREFTAGQDADKAGQYDAAIEHYLRANELLSHPFTLYNIAVDYERLGKLREAAEWYQRYLDAEPSSPDRDKVVRTLADLRAKKTPLSVRTLPPGADVSIDGQRAGVSPVFTKLAGGTHHVVVDLGGQHAEKDVDLGFGEPADVAFTLGGLAGTLSVGGTPLGAYVAVDNITVGILPATTQISPGEHTIRVTASGFAPYEGTANVAPNAETHVNADLVRTLGPIATPPTGQQSNIALLVGASGGAEVQSGTANGFAMIGTRILHYDLMFRAGTAHDGLALDFLFRWSLFDGPVTPFLAGGYAYTNGGYGYLVNGGLRWDVSRGDHTTLSLIIDGGVRVVPVSDTTSTSTATSTTAYPIELGAEVSFK